jgi:hypothetical protein
MAESSWFGGSYRALLLDATTEATTFGVLGRRIERPIQFSSGEM